MNARHFHACEHRRPSPRAAGKQNCELELMTTTAGANLIVEDKDTKLGKGKYDGNSFSISATCTREDSPKPAPKKKKK